MADEGTPLLVVPELANDRARAGRAHAAFFTIFVTICFFHFLLDGGLAFAEPGSGGSQSGSTVVSPPCCHSGSLAGRRATEASPACIPCPGSSSGAGSSIATAYSVWPACSDGTRVNLTVSGGKLGPYPPQWPIPTVSGLFYTSAFLPCSKLQKGTADCWWRSQKAGSDPKKHPALYECDRTTDDSYSWIPRRGNGDRSSAKGAACERRDSQRSSVENGSSSWFCDVFREPNGS
jgi:hypothetical protein